MSSGLAHAEAISSAEARGSAALWFGVLGAPLAWAAQLAGNYVLEEWLSCAPGSATPGKLVGIAVERWVLAISTATTLVALAALLLALACHRRLRASDASTGNRARWMASAGIINSTIFLVPLALGFASPLLLDACRSAS